MAAELTGRPREIIEQGKNYAHVAIPRPDGTVQTVITWAQTDDNGGVSLNSAEGRKWPENLRRAGTATVTLMAEGTPTSGSRSPDAWPRTPTRAPTSTSTSSPRSTST